MRFVLFYHSLVSDWNHGNAHFLRGVATELRRRGHDVLVYEPRDGWSRSNLLSEHGTAPIRDFACAYPDLRSVEYDVDAIDLDAVLAQADVVIVHEWNDPELVRRIGEHRRAGGGCYELLFHDTHHRSVSAPEEMSRYDLQHYDGVLAFGRVIRDIYRERSWAKRAWTWHEAADARVFQPMQAPVTEGDVVWVGNWGDEERTRELEEFLLRPVTELGLRAAVYGVRYPESARRELLDRGIRYHGWLPNYRVPEVFSRFRVTLHIPRRPYTESLPGIPTIRPFEAMACGIPLISAPWDDVEGLFDAGKDYLVAESGREMLAHLRRVLDDPDGARRMASRARRTILQRHTCAHRVDELLAICATLGQEERDAAAA